MGASVALQWTGTAISVYGEANASAVVVKRSWDDTVIYNDATDVGGGVLYSENGIQYGLNTLTLVVASGPVTIHGATITVGMSAPE